MINHVKLAALQGAKVLDYYFNQEDLNHVDEKSAVDFVSIADKESEKAIISELSALYPEIPIWAEESGGGKTDRFWLIDPLDGTKNFLQGIPYFSISIALIVNDEVVLALVYDPVHHDFFTAEKNKGAFRNEKRYKHSHNLSLEKSLIATGFPFKNREVLDAYLWAFKEIFQSCLSMRRCGSAALDLAYTSYGIYQGFWEYGLQAWDIAAGILLVQESGQIIHHFDKKKNLLYEGHTLAGQENCVTLMHEIVNKHFRGVSDV